MSFICPICKELLLFNNNPKNPNAQLQSASSTITTNGIIVTTKCGHLFHSSCLNYYFESGIETGGEEENKYAILSKSSCPTCQRVVLIKNLIQVYPAEDDNDPFGKLIARCNALVLRNEEIKKENELLKNENDDLWKLTGVTKPQIGSGNMRISGGLEVEDRIVWFPDISNDDTSCKPESGQVKWIGRINEILYAGIEFDDPIGNDISDQKGEQLFPCKPKHGKFVPVNELILYSDFYLEASRPRRESAVGYVESLLPICKPEIISEKISTFERQLNGFISLMDQAAAEYRAVQDDSKRLVTEEIIAIPSAIEEQLKRSTELRSDLICKEGIIKNLKQMSLEILQCEDITTQEIAILKGGIELLEHLRDNSKQNLSSLRFNTALTHSQKIKSFLQAGFRWLNEMEYQFVQLTATNTGLNEKGSKFTIPELLRMKIDLEFRQPQMANLAAAYNFFQTPGFKLNRNHQTSLKSALDGFEELKNKKDMINNILLRDANRMLKLMNDWCDKVVLVLDTEYGEELLTKLEELASLEEKVREAVPNLTEVKNALTKDNENGFSNGFEDLSQKIEETTTRVDIMSLELKSEIKQLNSKPDLPAVYY